MDLHRGIIIDNDQLYESVNSKILDNFIDIVMRVTMKNQFLRLKTYRMKKMI